MKPLEKIHNLINSALKEDIGGGDITTNILIPAEKMIKAKITAKQSGIICGLDVAGIVFETVDRRIRINEKVKDGQRVNAGKVIAIVEGPARGILTAERTALNFLQRLSGISTLTSAFVKAAGNKVRILDTRKTAPGMRALEKYAVKMGGGINHRFGLFDAVLIKDNHLSVVGSISKAIVTAKKKYQKIEVEVKNMKEVKEAVNAGASRIMLDNMSIGNIKKAVKVIRKMNSKIEIEASGGIDISNIKKAASTGVDFVSIGGLTHSAKALDISLKVA
jgi:nicotinate-nucleotide pyrophosphorylase (carboxylating)